MSDPVIAEIVSAIHVRQLQTPIGMAAPFTRNGRTDEVEAHMDRLQHDVTPIFPEENSKRGLRERFDPDGTLARSDLEGMDPSANIRAAVRPLAGNVLIDSRSNLSELLDRFRADHTFLLVVGSRGLDGIVTPSDMNKQAGRTHLFMHVSALELALADRLRAAARSEEEILRLVSPERARQVRSRLQKQRKSDRVADLVATLDFQDLLLIERAAGTSDLRHVLSLEQVEGLSDFRNRIMHSVLRPAGDAPERLHELLDRMKSIERLLDAISGQPGNFGA